MINYESPSWLHLPCEGSDCYFGLRGVLDYSEAEDHVKRAQRKRKPQDIRLRNSVRRRLRKVFLICFDGVAEIHGGHAGAAPKQDFGKSSRPASTLEDLLPRQIAPQSFTQAASNTLLRYVGSSIRIQLCEPIPLPLRAKRVGIALHSDEAGNPIDERKMLSLGALQEEASIDQWPGVLRTAKKRPLAFLQAGTIDIRPEIEVSRVSNVFPQIWACCCHGLIHQRLVYAFLSLFLFKWRPAGESENGLEIAVEPR